MQLSKMSAFGLLLVAGYSLTFSYEWTAPETIDKEYHPGVKHHRGLVADFETLSREVQREQTHLDRDLNLSLEQRQSLGMQSLLLSWQAKYLGWSLGSTVEARETRSEEGEVSDWADPWFAASYTGGAWGVGLRWKPSLAESNTFNQVNPSQGSQTFALNSYYGVNLSGVTVSGDVLYAYNLGQDWQLGNGGATRNLNEGQWLQFNLGAELPLGEVWSYRSILSWSSMLGGEIEVQGFKADLANYQSLRSTHAWTYAQEDWSFSWGVDLVLMESVDTDHSTRVHASLSKGFDFGLSKVEGSSKKVVTELPAGEPEVEESVTEVEKVSATKVSEVEKAPAASLMGVPAGKARDVTAEEGVENQSGSAATTPAEKVVELTGDVGNVPAVPAIGESTSKNEEPKVIHFTVEEPDAAEAERIRKAREAREKKRLKELQENLKKRNLDSLAKKVEGATGVKAESDTKSPK